MLEKSFKRIGLNIPSVQMPTKCSTRRHHCEESVERAIQGGSLAETRDPARTKNNSTKHGNSVTAVFGVLLGFVWHSRCYLIVSEAFNRVVGPVVRVNSAGVKRRGRSGNSPVPAHMGAWPEREAPAEKCASAFFAVEREMDSSISLSVALCFFLRAVRPQ
jgi:hypothetical protein